MRLTAVQTDRAVGALLGAAVGDALGVPYEYGSHPLADRAEMLGGGLGTLAPGQWSDDTDMAVCIAEVAATGADRRTPHAQDAIADGFLRGSTRTQPDVGSQTPAVLSDATGRRRRHAHPQPDSARAHRPHRRQRVADAHLPVALAHLGDTDAIAQAARSLSDLTHRRPPPPRTPACCCPSQSTCDPHRRARRTRRTRSGRPGLGWAARRG